MCVLRTYPYSSFNFNFSFNFIHNATLRYLGSLVSSWLLPFTLFYFIVVAVFFFFPDYLVFFYIL